MHRIISGIQPTGDLHLGNYLSMIKPIINIQNNNDVEILMFIADYHTTTTNMNSEIFKKNIIDMVIDCLACGINPNKIIFFRQYDIKPVIELAWILSCVTPISLLKRSHSYKDKINEGIMPNCGLFYYPILMAADILLYKSEVVITGKDQQQHIEITRDIASKFNNIYNNNIFILPVSKIFSDVSIVPGIDGKKMSKSYNNTIKIFDNENNIKKSIFKIITDVKIKNPEECIVFKIYKSIATKEETIKMIKLYSSHNVLYSDIKKQLYDIFMDYFYDIRLKRKELMHNLDYVKSIISNGANKALEIANPVINQIREIIGIK